MAPNKDQFIDNAMAGFKGAFMEKSFIYDEETSKFDLQVFLDTDDDSKRSDLLKMLKENMGEEYIFVNHKTLLFKKVYYFDCMCATQKRNGVKGKYSKKTACGAYLRLSYYDKRKASNKKGAKAAEARNAKYPLLINLHLAHNHPLLGEYVKKLSVSREVKEIFLGYFGQRMGPAEALDENEKRLREDPKFEETWLADGRRHPPYATAHAWHANFRDASYGGLSDQEVRAELQKRKNDLAKKGIVLEISKKELAVGIVTPLMGRVHAEKFSGNLLFMDSTGACDRTSANVTTLSAQEPHCRLTVPVGIIISSSKGAESYEEGLGLIDVCLTSFPRAWGGARGPAFAMIDHDPAEAKALRKVYKGIVIQICSVHVLKAVYKAISDGKHGLSNGEQKKYFREFKALMVVESKSGFQKLWDEFLDKLRRNRKSTILNYFEKVYVGCEAEWAYCYRDYQTRNNHSNNVSERAVLTVKQEILKRIRCFNIVELVDYIAGEYDRVYAGRLLRFAFGKDSGRLAQIKAIWQKGRALEARNSFRGGLPKPEVESQHTKGKFYEVDTYRSTCQCGAGYLGATCKHMAAVALHFNTTWDYLAVYDQQSRFDLALLASGPNAGHRLAHFQSLTPQNVPNSLPMAQTDAPVTMDFVEEPGVEADILGVDLDATANNVFIVTQDEENDLYQKSMSLMRLHKRAAKMAVATHGAPAVHAAMDRQINLLSKIASGGQYMTHLQMQAGSIQSTRRRKIGVNNSAVQRRTSRSGSRSALKAGAPRRKTPHKRIGNVGAGLKRTAKGSTQGSAKKRAKSSG